MSMDVALQVAGLALCAKVVLCCRKFYFISS